MEIGKSSLVSWYWYWRKYLTISPEWFGTATSTTSELCREATFVKGNSFNGSEFHLWGCDYSRLPWIFQNVSLLFRSLYRLWFSSFCTNIVVIIFIQILSDLSQYPLIGYRMAAECARDALLQKVMDHKEDPGSNYWVTNATS